MISIAALFDTRENYLFSVGENNQLMIYLFLGENKFIQQAIMSTDMQKKMLFFYSF